MQTKQEIKDGFAEVFDFHEHKSQLKGLQMMDAEYDQAKSILYGSSKSILMFYSWDTKCVLLWQYNNCNDEELVSSGIMDRGPAVINKLKFPQDGYIPAIIYISKLRLFLAAALDMTFRLYDRKFNLVEVIKHEERVILTLEYDAELNLIIAAGASGISIWKLYRNVSIHLSHCIEKLFTFTGIGNDWASKIIFEPKFDNIYLIGNTCVTVLGLRRRRIVAKLENIHECPVTKACWYPRSQFYLTSCTQGLVKCWTNHFSSESPVKKVQDDNDEITTKFALLHTYYAHNGPVTGLCLHEVSGLAISTGMDNTVKVLNLEALYILYSFDFGSSVTFFRTTYFGGQMGCLFASNEGLIKYWKPSACGTFYGVVSSDVYGVIINEEMQYDKNYVSSLPVTSTKPGVSFSMNNYNPPTSQNYNITIIGDHDLRVCGEKGNLISILDAAVIADGIKSVCVSVHQQFLFVLTGNGHLGVYCLRTLACPLLYTVPLKDLNIDGANVITLVNYSPTFKKKTTSDGHQKTSIRGEMVPTSIHEVLVVGTDNSLLYFLDSLDGFSNIYAHSLSQGCVSELKYSSKNQSLLVVFYDVNSILVNFVLFQMPEMQIMHELSNITKYSCINYNCIMNLLGIGYSDGSVCIFSLLHGLINPVEIEQQSHSHNAAVTSISFCDNLRIFASASSDGTIFFWDISKILVRIIRFNSPVKCICFSISPPFGGLIVNQNKYILIVKRDKWDEGAFLQAVRDNKDPWSQDGWIKGKGVLTKAEEELLGIVGTEKQLLAEIFDEMKEQFSHTETLILPTKTALKTTTKSEIDAFSNVTGKVNVVTTCKLDYQDRLHANGAPLNVTRPRYRINQKPSVTIKIKDLAVPNTQEMKELRAMSPIRISSQELYLFGPRPPDLSNKPSSVNASRSVVISPRVDEEYMKTRAVTYGLGAGTVQETPTIVLDKNTGEAKLTLPSSFTSQDDTTNTTSNTGHHIQRLNRDEAMKALHQFRFFDSVGKQVPEPPAKDKATTLSETAFNDLLLKNSGTSSKKSAGRRNSMINDVDLKNSHKNKLLPEDYAFKRNKDRGTMLSKKQHTHAIKESHKN